MRGPCCRNRVGAETHREVPPRNFFQDVQEESVRWLGLGVTDAVEERDECVRVRHSSLIPDDAVGSAVEEHSAAEVHLVRTISLERNQGERRLAGHDLSKEIPRPHGDGHRLRWRFIAVRASTRTSVVNVPRTMRSSSPLALASSWAVSTVLAQFITPSCGSVALSRFACACLKEVIFCDVGMRASFDVSLPHCSRNARRMRIGGSPSATRLATSASNSPPRPLPL